MTDENMKPNEWLSKGSYIKSLNYSDSYYLETLCRYIDNFRKNAPIPIIIVDPKDHKDDNKNFRLYFAVGVERKAFEIDSEISYFDFLTIIKRWLVQFYPQYKILHQKTVPLTDEEIIEMQKKAVLDGEHFDINEALLLNKKTFVEETGLIEKITLKSDEFTFLQNGNRYIRISGNTNNIMPLSTFLKKVRSITPQTITDKLSYYKIPFSTSDNLYKVLYENVSEEECMEVQAVINKLTRNFIIENSKEVKPLSDKKKEIIINYPGNKLLNFFKINYPDLCDYELIEIEPFVYKWGHYKIKFENGSLKYDCLEHYRKRRIEC